MATQSKAQYLADILALLKRRYKLGQPAPRLSVLEAVAFGIGLEGATRAQAGRALHVFKADFFDWNEVRVSAVAEIQDVFQKAGIPDAEDRATRLRRFLRQLFEKSYSFNLEPLAKKPLKESIKSLQEFEALGSDFVMATVIRMALGGHAIGVDRPIRRALERLGVAEAKVDDLALRAAIERAVPKNRGAEFVDLIEELAHDTCVEGEPDCPRCELRKVCPSSRTRKPDPAAKAAAHARPSAAAKVGPAAKPAAPRPAPPVKGPAPATPAAKPARPTAAKPGPAKAAAAPAPGPAPSKEGKAAKPGRSK